MSPELSVRELVANANIHQDLALRGTGPMILNAPCHRHRHNVSFFILLQRLGHWIRKDGINTYNDKWYDWSAVHMLIRSL